MDKNETQAIVEAIRSLGEQMKYLREDFRDFKTEVKEELKEIKSDDKELRKKVDDIWDVRKEVKATFDNGFIIKTVAFNAVIILIAGFFFKFAL